MPAPHGLSWLVGVYAFELREGLNDTSAGRLRGSVRRDPGFGQPERAVERVSLAQRRALRPARRRSGRAHALVPRGARRAPHQPLRRHARPIWMRRPRRTISILPNDLWGGHLSLDTRIADGQHVYALISRGYKAGGFNLSPGFPPDQLQFAPESDLNFELGHKAQLDGRQTALRHLPVLHGRRSEQLLTSEQLVPTNPDTFIFYTGNAKSGYNYGLESTLAWAARRAARVGRLARAAADPLPGVCAKWRRACRIGRCRTRPPGKPRFNATWRDPRGPYARARRHRHGCLLSTTCRRTKRVRAPTRW